MRLKKLFFQPKNLGKTSKAEDAENVKKLKVFQHPYIVKVAVYKRGVGLNMNYPTFVREKIGLSRDLNPGPPAPKAGIIPLDH